MGSIIDFDSHLQVEEAKTLIRSLEKSTSHEPTETSSPLTGDLLDEIKRKLNPNIRTQPEKNYYVPDEVNIAMEKVSKRVKEFGIEIKETHPIQYGRKIVFILGDRWAQLNLFYGKNGFKIVKTPVNKSDAELAEVVFSILCEQFYGNQHS